MELLNDIMQNLGVNEDQAKGGAGLIFKLAKEKLGDEDFGKVAEIIPGVNDMMNASPEGGGITGALGGIASSLGGGVGKLGDLASLAGGFSKLGLDAGMVGKFIPVILSFVQSKGGDTVKNLLQGVLK